MDGAERYLSDLIGYWAFLSNESLSRWSDASRRIRRRKYSPKRAFSDALGFWNDAAMGWLGVLRGSVEDAQSVLFHLTADTQADRKRIGPFFRPSIPRGKLQLIWFGRIKKFGSDPGNADEINEANLRVFWSKDGSMVDIRIKGLAKGGRVTATGVYHGLVHVEDFPIAEIYVRVDPVPSYVQTSAPGEECEEEEETP